MNIEKYLKKQIAYNKKLSHIHDEDIAKRCKEEEDLYIIWIWSNIPDVNGILFTTKHLRQVAKLNKWSIEIGRYNIVDSGRKEIGIKMELTEATVHLKDLLEQIPLDYTPLLQLKLLSKHNNMDGIVKMCDIPDL